MTKNLSNSRIFLLNQYMLRSTYPYIFTINAITFRLSKIESRNIIDYPIYFDANAPVKFPITPKTLRLAKLPD